MFKQESMFEAKVFLKSYADAIETIKYITRSKKHHFIPVSYIKTYYIF